MKRAKQSLCFISLHNVFKLTGWLLRPFWQNENQSGWEAPETDLSTFRFWKSTTRERHWETASKIFHKSLKKNPLWSATFGLPSSISRPFSRTQILLLSITVCSLGDQSHMLLRGIPNFFSGSYLLLVLMYWEPVCNRKHWAFRKLISELQPMEMNANKNAVVHVIIMKLTMLLNHNFQ